MNDGFEDDLRVSSAPPSPLPEPAEDEVLEPEWLSSDDTEHGPRWPDERAASAHLTERGLTTDWARRADWLENEAKSEQLSPQARARRLLAAAELRAMLDMQRRARRDANQGNALHPGSALLARECRALALADRDMSTVAKQLGAEIRAARTPAQRVHAQLLSAEVQRIGLKDREQARQMLEQASQGEPPDARATLGLLGLELSSGADAPRVAWHGEQVRALADATATIARLRSAEAPEPPGEGPRALWLIETKRALAQNDVVRASEHLSRLEGVPGLRAGVRWLVALWLGVAADTRARALEAQRRLVREQPGIAERRELAALALELAHPEALLEALAEPEPSIVPPAPSRTSLPPGSAPPAASPAFSAPEVAALRALLDLPAAPQPDEQEQVEPFQSALERLSGVSPADPALVKPFEAGFELGRRAASGDDWAELVGYARSLPEDGIWAALLELEQQREAGDVHGVARLLPQAAPDAAQARFIAGLLLESRREIGAARLEYEAALGAGIVREPAARALCRGASPTAVAQLLRGIASGTDEPLTRALLLLEAAFQLPIDDPQLYDIVSEAVRMQPELPFGYQLGEAAARQRGDVARRIDWLRRRQRLQRDPREQALDTIREALLVGLHDRAGAAALLDRLSAERPHDLALFNLRERFAPPAAAERARWRRQAAASSQGRQREQLLQQAAWELEQAGEHTEAIECARASSSALGRVLLERLARSPDLLDEIIGRVQAEAEAESDVAAKCDLYERLSALALRRGDAEQAMSWQRAILSLEPERLSALRSLERALMRAGPLASLEPAAAELAQRLGSDAGLGHCFIAARLKLDRGAWSDTLAWVRLARGAALPPLWSLRLGAAQATRAGDDQALLELTQALAMRSEERIDRATLQLKGAEAALRLGRLTTAHALIDRARETSPDNVVILAARAEILKARSEHAQAAEAYEALAAATQVKTQRVEAWYLAALLWNDLLHDSARAERVLLQAVNDDCNHAGVYGLLSRLYLAAEDYAGVFELTSKRLELASDARETTEIRVLQAEALSALGRTSEARALLDAVLAEQPQHAGALHALGKVLLQLKDYFGAEQNFVAAFEHTSDNSLRLRALRALARLCDRELSDGPRALTYYQRVVELDPNDRVSLRRLVKIASASSDAPLAVRLQTARFEQAKNEEERRRTLLELVELHEKGTGDHAAARALLEQARRTWPDDASVLSAEVGYYRRAGQQAELEDVARRALASARAAIASGRLDPAVLRTLRVASRFAGKPEVARSAQALLYALNGESAGLWGAGSRAGHPSFDELLAPTALSRALRELLYLHGSALERAFAPPLEKLDVRPLPTDLAAQVQAVAAAFGELSDVQVRVSPRLGSVCIPLGNSPAYVVFGERLLTHATPRVRDFLLLRALKIAQARACALTQMTDADVGSTLAGLLTCFKDDWQPPGVDAERVLWVKNHLRPHLIRDARGHELAAELSQSFDPSVSLGKLFYAWGSRVALLGVGEPRVAFDSLWAASEQAGDPPVTLQGRARWIAASDEARDLVGFALSDAYADARRSAGLGRRSG